MKICCIHTYIYIHIYRTIASSMIQEYWLHPRYRKFGTSLKCLLILFLGQNLETFLCQQCEHFFYEITFTFKSSDTSWQALFTFVCVNESRSHLLFSTFSLNLISFFRLAMKWPYLKWAKCVLPLGNKKGKLVELSYHENFLHQIAIKE